MKLGPSITTKTLLKQRKFLCRTFDQLGSCVEDNVRSVCNNKEGDFAETLMSLYLVHLKSAINCDDGTKAKRAGKNGPVNT